jgi:hypothetical protein
MDRPSPGYEHRFVVDPAAREDLKLPADQIIQIFSKGGAIRDVSVDRAVQERNDQLALASAKRDELKATSDPQQRARLKAEIETHMQPIRDISEALGVAAGKAFAQSEYRDAEIIIMRGGGVPDLLVKMPPAGPVVVIECKGGQSPLGTRLSADKTLRVEQGTKEYLISLATEMEMSDPTDRTVQEYGRLLLDQLTDPAAPDTRYYVVRQPFGEAGEPAPVEVGQFDTSGKKPAPAD